MGESSVGLRVRRTNFAEAWARCIPVYKSLRRVIPWSFDAITG